MRVEKFLWRKLGGQIGMSAIVVAGGVSKRFGQDKGSVKLDKKPLVLHVLDKVISVVNEVVVVVNSEDQKRKYAELAGRRIRFVVDGADVQTPLAGALAGFKNVHHKYALLLACDTPFLSSEILNFLLEVCENKTAAIPRWPNGHIEPLQAAYHAKLSAKAAKTALAVGQMDMNSMIANMRNIRYISSAVLRQFDAELATFFNVNTPHDLKKAEIMIKHHVY